MNAQPIAQGCEEWECPWCKKQCGGVYPLMRHVSKCPDNPGVDPEPEKEQ